MNPQQLLAHFNRVSDAPDAIPRLRRFILNLAVRGKLVEQDLIGERVDGLYMNERKKGGLPENWRLLNFEKFCDIQGGNQPPKSRFVDEPREGYVRLFQIRDLGEKPAPIFIPVETTNRFCRSGEILIGRYGASIGKIFWAQDGAYNVALAKFIYPENAFVPAFAFLVLKSNFFQEKMTGATRSAQAGFNKGDLSTIDFPLPPLAEQHRIVAKVEELMALCDQLKDAQKERELRRDKILTASLGRLNDPADDTKTFRENAQFFLNTLPRTATRPEHVRQLRQTILSLAVRGKLVPQNPNDEPASELLNKIRNWQTAAIAQKKIRLPRKALSSINSTDVPYELPIGWQGARLGEIIYIHSGDGLTAEEMIPNGIPVFGGNGINGYHNSANVHRETIVIGRVGYYCGSIHITPPKAWITDNAFITEFCPEAIHQDFLVLLLRATDLKEKEDATAQPVISGTKIYPLIIGLPPLAEQKRIVAKVEELMGLCDQLEQQITNGQNATKKLLEALLADELAA